jgi:quercetin dioxygenase-like cupin family protein
LGEIRRSKLVSRIPHMVLSVIGVSALIAGRDSQRAFAANPLSRARIVVQKASPSLDGTHPIASVVDVHYSRGESSPRHRHPCPLIAYVIERAVRVHIRGQQEAVYKAGESFCEAPNGIHELTENVSAADPARLAFFVCDHRAPLTEPLDEHHRR